MLTAEAEKAAQAAKRAIAAAVMKGKKPADGAAGSQVGPVASAAAPKPVPPTASGTGAPVSRPALTAAPTGCESAGRAIKPPGWYTVARGDTLSQISKAHYVSSKQFRKIAAANSRRLESIHMIHPCQKIFLPK